MEGRNENNVLKRACETPPIPKLYRHIEGKWNNGYVIENTFNNSQFVWVPVEILNANGTLDGIMFTKKFGRRKYGQYSFSMNGFNEPLKYELEQQIESVQKYGGFYISRYLISKNKITGRPQSKKDEIPWTNIEQREAKRISKEIGDNETVFSHLTYGAEYDSILEWFIVSKAKQYDEIAENSSTWGNYKNVVNSPKRITNTGSQEKWCVNRIYDFAGNVDEWTQEQYGYNMEIVSRGGSYEDSGSNIPVAYRDSYDIVYKFADTGFRIALCIK